MKTLSGLNLEELETFALSLNEPKFRASQLHSWIYKKSASSFEQMTNLSKTFREKLSREAQISDTKIKKRQISFDGTIKYLLEYPDEKCVETVLMRFDNRANLTACVSSQIGCALNCSFCATAKRGFVRNLTAAEIVEQILTIQRDTGLKITNVVFMGQGEPLLNSKNVYRALELINNDLQIGIRRITLSTAGITPEIIKLCNNKLIPTLAISLHAPNVKLRNQIMPVSKKFHLSELIDSLKTYNELTKNRVTIEYVLLHGVNDSLENARELSELIKPIKCNVNLIPYNENEFLPYKKPSQKDVAMFRYVLEKSGKKVTVRLERGKDIDAACGQLNGKIK